MSGIKGFGKRGNYDLPGVPPEKGEVSCLIPPDAV